MSVDGERSGSEPISVEQFETLLPMIADYQRFYEVEDIDEERNRAFFRRFIAPSDGRHPDRRLGRGAAARLRLPLLAPELALRAAETVLMNDLYVDEAARQGRRPGADRGQRRDRPRPRRPHLEWSTAPDNRTAQRLYDSTGAEKRWVEYELPV